MYSSQIVLQEHKNWGGDSYDYPTFAAMYSDENPHDFGVMASRIWSSATGGGQINNKWRYLTMAQNNYCVLPGGKDDYRWTVLGDSQVEYRVTKVIEPTGSHGKNGKIFEIVVDYDYLHEPMALKSQDDDAPLALVKGRSVQIGMNQYKVQLQIQDGNPNSYWTDELIDLGAVFTRVSAPVTDEINTKYASDTYAQGMKLQGITGQVANKIEFTDKFLRAERRAAKNKTVNNSSYSFNKRDHNKAFQSGSIFQTSLLNGQNKRVTKDMFVSYATARLMERCEEDINLLCEFGRHQITKDFVTGKAKKIAAGWRQLSQDGQVMNHNGSFTLDQFFDFLHQVYQPRSSFKNREAYLVGGQGAAAYISNLIAAQASNILVDSGVYIRKSSKPTGVHENELEYGAQFTRIKMPNGIIVTILIDPMKDDQRIFKTKAPGSFLPLESFQIDILDFGDTTNAPNYSNGKNITMVKQDGVDEFYSVSGVWDLKKGAPITDGSNAYTNSKEAGVFRTEAGSLCIWDVSAVGRINWVLN